MSAQILQYFLSCIASIDSHSTMHRPCKLMSNSLIRRFFTELNGALFYVGVPVLSDKRVRYASRKGFFGLSSSACTDNAGL